MNKYDEADASPDKLVSSIPSYSLLNVIGNQIKINMVKGVDE